MPSYYLWTVGCQMNHADAATLRRGLQEAGFVSTGDPLTADLVVLITCVVRQSAEDRVTGRLTSLKNLKQRNPQAAITVMGCFVHDEAHLHASYPYVDAFFRPSDVAGFFRWLDEWCEGKERAWSQTAAQATSAQSPVCALVPISYGCDHHCTYCIVRIRRGSQCSRPLGDIMSDAASWVSRGAREVTLLGQNVDAYGQDLGTGAPDLADVLTSAHGVDGLWRIRFLTSHPAHLSRKLIHTVAHLPKVCPHFELPVQSGHDDILRRMGRHYSVSDYRALVQAIRQDVPRCSIATDVIVGFPGETREQFQATSDLLTDLRFDAVHIAKYSPRPGTPAAHLVDDVQDEEKERRRATLDGLQTDVSARINAGLLGQVTEVLVEARHGNRWKGRTRNNKLVFFEHHGDWHSQLASVEITWAGPWSLVGQPIIPKL